MQNKIKIKVCGMRDHQNILDVAMLDPDYMGFIFYPKSPRFAGNILNPETTRLLPDKIHKTGVFVNATLNEIKETSLKFNLSTAQLHGNESPDLCKELRENGLEVIKAFSLKKQSDLNATNQYREACDFFLFDTPTARYGGSGKKFDWSILEGILLSRPFFLSGGIEAEDASGILKECPIEPYALDINSKFETAPGFKEIASVEKFIKTIRQQ
ncbi:phosphoribosylanthranilate isomerase [Marinilabilia salmonicolor]|jgi:phosphoribosylanthranilate isomerase|nr:phosphoribosylanthranilate isomerase [Marinilabilia salmonicolor]